MRYKRHTSCAYFKVKSEEDKLKTLQHLMLFNSLLAHHQSHISSLAVFYLLDPRTPSTYSKALNHWLPALK